jgi:hypothetical protein
MPMGVGSSSLFFLFAWRFQLLFRVRNCDVLMMKFLDPRVALAFLVHPPLLPCSLVYNAFL